MHFSLRALATIAVALTIGVTMGCGGHHAETEEHHAGDGHDHGEHASEGPHHGHLIELGKEEYHAELVHDEATKRVTIYLLDGSAKASVAIPDQEVVVNLAVNGKLAQYKLPAAPETTDPQGQCSRFSLVSAELLEALESPKTSGRLNVTIKNQPFSGAIEHEAHGAHEHK